MLQLMLDRLAEAGLLKAGGRQRTDGTHVLAEAAPAWLTPLIEPEWAKRYGRRVEIGKLPGGKAAVAARAEQFGRDGQKVLTAAWATRLAPPAASSSNGDPSPDLGPPRTTGTRTNACAGGTATPCRLPRCGSHEIQTQKRLDQKTEQWQHRDAIRGGVEATLSQNVRAHGLRRSRYRGLVRTHALPHPCSATS
ncbi:transposase [Streptomyces sp. NPDC006285]|uniref:transposase n=1 Tax=Streptomyces sp. NPDC006285 TaxID=3364742 RepID=UPI0036CC058C